MLHFNWFAIIVLTLDVGKGSAIIFSNKYIWDHQQQLRNAEGVENDTLIRRRQVVRLLIHIPLCNYLDCGRHCHCHNRSPSRALSCLPACLGWHCTESSRGLCCCCVSSNNRIVETFTLCPQFFPSTTTAAAWEEGGFVAPFDKNTATTKTSQRVENRNKKL